MKRKKIAIIIHKPYPAHTEYADDKRINHIIKILSQKFHTVVVAPFGRPDQNKKTLKIRRIKTSNYPILKRVELSKKILDEIKKERNIDYIIINSPLGGLYIDELKKLTKAKVIFDVMGIVSEESKLRHGFPKNIIYPILFEKLEKKMFFKADIIVTINNEHKKKIKIKYKRSAIVIRDAGEKFLIKQKRKKLEESFRILFIGSLNRDRLRILIDAVQSIPEKNISVEVVGTGRYEKKYKKIKNVKMNFHGYKPQKEYLKLIKSSDILFSDVYLSGFPYKIFEYMNSNVPIIVEDSPGVQEIIKDGFNGMTFSTKQELANKIRTLISNEKLCRKIGEQAQNDFLKHHTWKNRKNQILNLIK